MCFMMCRSWVSRRCRCSYDIDHVEISSGHWCCVPRCSITISGGVLHESRCWYFTEIFML